VQEALFLVVNLLDCLVSLCWLKLNWCLRRTTSRVRASVTSLRAGQGKVSQLGHCVMRASHWNLLASLALAAFFSPSIAAPASARDVVAFNREFAPGTIVVRTHERRLYLVIGDGRALRYKVGVGRVGRQWAGHSIIDGKHIRPDWSPPPYILKDHPNLPRVIPGGSPKNPMGVAALTLSGGQYAIHGTNNPGSIGGFVSYGCIRMYNQDITDLFDRVSIGTPVVVTR
jgi:lipoprotein-anchoring transpeptidase ErfK/SrfK